jgi:hypothetical protein
MVTAENQDDELRAPLWIRRPEMLHLLAYAAAGFSFAGQIVATILRDADWRVVLGSARLVHLPGRALFSVTGPVTGTADPDRRHGAVPVALSMAAAGPLSAVSVQSSDDDR